MWSRRRFIQCSGISITGWGLVDWIFARTAAAGPVSLQDGQPTPPAPLKNMLAGIEPLPPAEFAARREKARRLLVEQKLDGIFLEGGAGLQYFTNVNWGRSERVFGVLLLAKGDPVWIVSGFELERARESVPAGQEIRTWEEHENPYRLMADVLAARGIRKGRLAMESSTRGFILFGLRQHAPGLELVNGNPVTEACRAIKSSRELAFLDLANTITKLAYRQAFGRLREGMSPAELAAQVAASHQEQGVAGGGWPQFGPNTAFPHGSRIPRQLAKGDVLMVDGGCSVEGYRSDVTRTLVFGPPGDRQRKLTDIVIRAQRKAFQAVRPGVPCGEIDRVARRIIEEAGFGPDYRFFAHRLGHGIGLEGHEYPYLVKDNPLPLQAGMTFSNEPGIYVYGEYGIRTEDCFAVTGEGAVWLGGMLAEAIDIPFAAAN